MIINKPTHIVYHIKDTQDEAGQLRSFWTKIGAAWTNKDGKGLSVVLNLLPLDGRLVIREATQVPSEDERPNEF